MNICGRHTEGSPTILVTFLDFWEMKLLEEELPQRPCTAFCISICQAGKATGRGGARNGVCL